MGLGWGSRVNTCAVLRTVPGTCKPYSWKSLIRYLGEHPFSCTSIHFLQMTALYSLCECAIIYLTIWLNSFRIWYYKDWFKEIHSFKCTWFTWLLAWTTCFGASCPLHLLLPFPGTFFISSLTTWMNTVQRPALSSKVLSRKALWLPDRPCLPVTSSWGPSCPSPASVSFSDWLSPLKTVHGVWPSRNPTMHPWAWRWACAYQPLLTDGYRGLDFSHLFNLICKRLEF